MKLTVGDLVKRFELVVDGNTTLSIDNLAPLNLAKSTDLAFLSNATYRQQALQTGAGALLVSESDAQWLRAEGLKTSTCLLIAKNPYAVFARVAQIFYPRENLNPTIDTSSVVSVTAQIDPSAHIGPLCRIGANVKIGPGVTLVSGVSVGDDVTIGAHSYLYPNVSIYSACHIGQRNIIHSGAVIGADGFGFAPDLAHEEWVKIPQVGGVRLGDDVEIGANTCIDRGAMADTVIGDGCKIDNLVQIAHNVQIGRLTVIAGLTAIAGSTEIGSFCMIGGASSIAGHLKIADRTTISGGTTVIGSIQESGQQITSIFPMMPHRDWEKNAAILRSLDKMRKQIKELEKKLNQLPSGSQHE